MRACVSSPGRNDLAFCGTGTILVKKAILHEIVKVERQVSIFAMIMQYFREDRKSSSIGYGGISTSSYAHHPPLSLLGEPTTAK